MATASSSSSVSSLSSTAATSTPVSLLTPTERLITISPELTLSSLTYGDPSSSLRILGVHGWVDNAATFELTVPTMVNLGFYVVNIDLPGHGKSNHRPPSCFYSAIEYCANVIEVLEALQWDTCYLCGHSLGGGICTVVASVLKERIKGLILVENIGLSYRSIEEAPNLFIKAVQSKRTLSRKNDTSYYNSIEEAVNQRMLTATTHPGKQYISKEGAERLVKRALIPIEIKNNTRGEGNTNNNGSSSSSHPISSSSPSLHSSSVVTSTEFTDTSIEATVNPTTVSSSSIIKFKFRHDRRILAPALLSASEEQILIFLKQITSPVLLITATSGWPFPTDIFQNRLQAIQTVLKTHVHLPGSHHLHLDNDTAPAVNNAIGAFLQQRITHTE